MKISSSLILVLCLSLVFPAPLFSQDTTKEDTRKRRTAPSLPGDSQEENKYDRYDIDSFFRDFLGCTRGPLAKAVDDADKSRDESKETLPSTASEDDLETKIEKLQSSDDVDGEYRRIAQKIVKQSDKTYAHYLTRMRECILVNPKARASVRKLSDEISSRITVRTKLKSPGDVLYENTWSNKWFWLGMGAPFLIPIFQAIFRRGKAGFGKIRVRFSSRPPTTQMSRGTPLPVVQPGKTPLPRATQELPIVAPGTTVSSGIGAHITQGSITPVHVGNFNIAENIKPQFSSNDPMLGERISTHSAYIETGLASRIAARSQEILELPPIKEYEGACIEAMNHHRAKVKIAATQGEACPLLPDMPPAPANDYWGIKVEEPPKWNEQKQAYDPPKLKVLTGERYRVDLKQRWQNLGSIPHDPSPPKPKTIGPGPEPTIVGPSTSEGQPPNLQHPDAESVGAVSPSEETYPVPAVRTWKKALLRWTVISLYTGGYVYWYVVQPLYQYYDAKDFDPGTFVFDAELTALLMLAVTSSELLEKTDELNKLLKNNKDQLSANLATAKDEKAKAEILSKNEKTLQPQLLKIYKETFRLLNDLNRTHLQVNEKVEKLSKLSLANMAKEVSSLLLEAIKEARTQLAYFHGDQSHPAIKGPLHLDKLADSLPDNVAPETIERLKKVFAEKDKKDGFVLEVVPEAVEVLSLRQSVISLNVVQNNIEELKKLWGEPEPTTKSASAPTAPASKPAASQPTSKPASAPLTPSERKKLDKALGGSEKKPIEHNDDD